MSIAPEFSAGEFFEAALVDHHGPGLKRTTRRTGRIVPTVGDYLMAEAPSVVDLVVRSKDDGTELIRTPADLASPEALLATAQEDLATMTVDEFLAEWRMPRD